jgi:hypothetical protein
MQLMRDMNRIKTGKQTAQQPEVVGVAKWQK